MKDSYQKYIYDFLKFDVLVTCPNCSKQAIVKSDNFSFMKIDESDVKVICISCGFNKRLIEKPTSVLYSSNEKTITGGHYIVGAAVDPFFHLPVWLKTDCEGNSLWAYNFEHLNFLKDYIEARLRERNGQDLANKSLGSRLPKWMTSKKNREIVLKKIHELQSK